MLLAQISDLHIREAGKLAYRVLDTAPYLERAVTTLNALDPQPDVVLATGDLVDTGSAHEYERLRRLLEPLRAPYYLMPGNHDHREALKRAFNAPYLPNASHLSYTIETAELRIVALDSMQPGEEGGHLDGERLQWLDERLSETRTPAIIAMHHPPFVSGLAGMDALGFTGLDAFGEVVRRHSHVVRIVCGHLHRAIAAGVFGTVASVAPSTAHQLSLDLRRGAPTMFTLEPPGFLLHHFTHETGLITHVANIGDFPGPYPFREAGALIR